MADYDKAKVDAWAQSLRSAPGVAWAVFAGLNPENPDIEAVMNRHTELHRMTPWEQVNALYALRDVMADAFKVLLAHYTAHARKEDP